MKTEEKTTKKLTCAKCGEKKSLCGSPKENGVQQPRICKECLLMGMNLGDWEINDKFWLRQLVEDGDRESVKKIFEQINSED